MEQKISRRQFFKVTGTGLASSSMALMGFSPSQALAEVRQFKLAETTVARQTFTLCPKGAGLLDFVNSPNRLKYPEYRAPGSDHWQRISWDDALDRIARLLKDDRDANFVQKTDDGKVVNRWTSTGMLAASAASNEAGYITHKVARSWGLLAFDNQARV